MSQPLQLLRVSVARIAQALGVDNDLKIAKDGYAELCHKAINVEVGWNNLAGLCADTINDREDQRSHVGTMTGLVTDNLTYSKVKVTSDQVEELVMAAASLVTSPDMPDRQDRLARVLKSILEVRP